MTSSALEQITTHIDAIVDGGELDDEMAVRLCEFMPAEGELAATDIEIALYVVEKPAVFDALEAGTAPAALTQAAAQLIQQVIPIFGDWNGAPLAMQIQRLRRQFEREKKKYKLVADKMGQESERRLEQITKAYLETSPAQIFVDQLSRQFPGYFQKAQALRSAEDQALVADGELVEMLEFDTPFDKEQAADMHRRLAAVAKKLGDVDAAIGRGVLSTDRQAKIVAGALAVHQGLKDQAANMLVSVVDARSASAQYAAFAAALNPELTRDILARFLVDALNERSSDDEQQIEEAALRRAIVAARTVLALLDSPVDDVEYVHDDAEAVAARVRRAWRFCDEWL